MRIVKGMCGCCMQSAAMRRAAAFCRKHIQRLGMAVDRRLYHRSWSNDELARFGGLFSGDIVNVSGWRDDDRSGENRRYADYFTGKRSYTVTNFSGKRGDEADPGAQSLFLDLEKPLPADMSGRFDVVFCHTTLEHVFDIARAADCLAGLSRDIVILVVPFIQNEHYDDGAYEDYWRFTPRALDRLLADRGFTTLYVSANEQPWFPVYVFYIASRKPGAWKGKFPAGATDILKKKLCAGYYCWKT